MSDFTEVLAARWIFPVSRRPINRGWIRRRIADGRIVELGAGSPPKPAWDLGDVALLPGLVNAHTHLEFSDCRQPIGHAGIHLADWIGQVIAARSTESQQARQRAIALGIDESRRAGVRLLGEITTPPSESIKDDPYAAIDWSADRDFDGSTDTVERVTFAEVLGLSQQRGAERLEASQRYHATHPSAGWSPHAPYSTTPALVDACVRLACRHRRPVAMHVAEAPEERELLTHGTGVFAEALRQLGVWREGLFPWGPDPLLRLIDRLAEAPAALLIHGNDLNRAEMERLAAAGQITVVYCPRTHAYFEHSRHPVDQMLACGVPVALGTDSRASNPDLNLWKEVQFLLDRRNDLAPEQIVRMATIHGADALGRSETGRIEAGSRPGIGQVATSGKTLDQVYADFCVSEFQPLAESGRAGHG